MSAFSDPEAVARYAEGPPRLVPGFADLQRMTLLLLRERIGGAGRVLVLGAGGGLELKVLAEAQPGWRFDGAICLLTLHFLPAAERLRTLVEVHRRLKPGAPFIVAHHSFPQGEGEKGLWLSRYAAFATSSGVERAKAQSAIAAIGAQLPVLSPEQDEALLREAGFKDISLFYAGFTFRGWVGYRS